jgi:CopG family transcriptional regulator, nickel-responsive regulator
MQMRNTKPHARAGGHSRSQDSSQAHEHPHSHDHQHPHVHANPLTPPIHLESAGLATRFSVSLPEGLARDLDAMVKEKNYASRSLAVADMVRDALVQHRQHATAAEIAGTITLVFDHHKRNLQETLTNIQHEHHETIISTLHVHLDHHNCLEVLVVRGAGDEIRAMADALIATKGVKHGKLSVTSTGKDLV